MNPTTPDTRNHRSHDHVALAPQVGACPIPKSGPERFTYIVLPASLCFARFGMRNTDAYIADEPETRLLEQAIKEGYRWVRSEDGNAIFEKRWTI